MTTGQKHEAIAAEYFRRKEMDNIIRHYDYGPVNEPDKEYIKKWLKKRGYDNVSDYLSEQDVF